MTFLLPGARPGVEHDPVDLPARHQDGGHVDEPPALLAQLEAQQFALHLTLHRSRPHGRTALHRVALLGGRQAGGVGGLYRGKCHH